MGVAPSLGGGVSPSVPKDITKLSAGMHEEFRSMRRPGRESDTKERGRMNYGREGKALLMESLNPNDFYANSLRMDRQLTNSKEGLYVHLYPGQPHWSQITYPVDIRTGQGIPKYYGDRPWRCNDRFDDVMASIFYFRVPPLLVALRCGFGSPGSEPTVPYTSLSRHDAEYYAERRQRGNIREYLTEKYPWDTMYDPIPPPAGPGPTLPTID
eukprot:TRINITY_DN38361_c0_g1_i1.p1 TRINITY_DN38361_c0_g1~~TRINITY_DN38361_c0_g1_i1.p1  ORF type:complete len:212 (+),score=42.44 TRINITY_DN38361_c0_g1_i1:151-786(+)